MSVVVTEFPLTLPIAVLTAAVVSWTFCLIHWLKQKPNAKHPTMKSRDRYHAVQVRSKRPHIIPQQPRRNLDLRPEEPHQRTPSEASHSAGDETCNYSTVAAKVVNEKEVDSDCDKKKIRTFEEEWIRRPDITPSDTECSATSCSSGEPKMTRRQKKNKKRRKKSIDKLQRGSLSDQINCYSPLDTFSSSYYMKHIGLNIASLYSLLMTICLSIKDRILSGFPFETKHGVYVYKGWYSSRVTAVLVELVLLGEEDKYLSRKEEYISFNSLDGQTNDKGFLDKYKKCVRCRENFGLLYNYDLYCQYHRSKPQLSEVGMLIFPCCGTVAPEKGCQMSKCHIYHQLKTGLNGPLSGFASTQLLSREPKILALDCEMIFTSEGFEVAKATVISLNEQILFDCFIKPLGDVYDYNTKYSGVKKKDLEKAITFHEAQLKLLRIISSSDILIGHSLESDLSVLKIIHDRVIDSSLAFQVEPSSLDSGAQPRRLGLKFLAKQYLGKDIQTGGRRGHDSLEDAKASLNLVLYKAMELMKWQHCN